MLFSDATSALYWASGPPEGADCWLPRRPDGWLAKGQRGQAAAIYLELRQIDARTPQQLSKGIEPARRHVREGEERIGCQQALMEKTENARYLGDARARGC